MRHPSWVCSGPSNDEIINTFVSQAFRLQENQLLFALDASIVATTPLYVEKGNGVWYGMEILIVVGGCCVQLERAKILLSLATIWY